MVLNIFPLPRAAQWHCVAPRITGWPLGFAGKDRCCRTSNLPVTPFSRDSDSWKSSFSASTRLENCLKFLHLPQNKSSHNLIGFAKPKKSTNIAQSQSHSFESMIFRFSKGGIFIDSLEGIPKSNIPRIAMFKWTYLFHPSISGIHVSFRGCTLPQTDILHLKIDGWKMNFLVGARPIWVFP